MMEDPVRAFGCILDGGMLFVLFVFLVLNGAILIELLFLLFVVAR